MKYSDETVAKIRRLYAKGYSASLIMESIGIIELNPFRSNAWLFYMRKHLNLPKRGMGFQGIKRTTITELENQIKNMEQRQEDIPAILVSLEKQKENLLLEYAELPSKKASLKAKLSELKEQMKTALRCD